MYIYKVTHTPSRQYYIGISKQHKNSFDDTTDIDPMKFFNLYESNGNGKATMVVCSKTMLAHSEEIEEIEKLTAQIVKDNQANPRFLGLKLETKDSELQAAKKKPFVKTSNVSSNITDTQ